MMKHTLCKKILATVLCVIMMLSLAACGQQPNTVEGQPGEGCGVALDDDGRTGNAEEDIKYVYVPEYIELDAVEEGGFINNLTISGDSVYYNLYEFDSETQTAKQAVCAYSLEDDTLREIPITVSSESYMISRFVPDADGNVYVLIEDFNSAEETSAKADIFLYQFDARGTVLLEKDITAIVGANGRDAYVNDIAVDAEGNVYLSVIDEIVFLNKEGEQRGSVEIRGVGGGCLGTGKDGKVYCSLGGTILYQIDFQAKEVSNSYSELPGISGEGFGSGITKDLLLHDGIKVYEYDLATQSYEELLNWTECGINGMDVRYVGATENGIIGAILQNRDTNAVEIVKLTKTDASQVSEKEEVVIAVLRENQDLQEAVVEFNKSSDEYRVTIRTYIDSNDWSSDSFTTAMTNLNNDIVSTTNCPDIIDLSTVDEEIYAKQGVFEDLSLYLEQSSVLDKEDFFENILECYTYEGKLLSIPATFYIDTIVGKTSVVGEEMGWTLEEMLACAKEHPEAVLFDMESNSSILYSCLLYNQDTFIDWEKGECYFNTVEFKQVLEFANLLPAEVENYSIGSMDVEGLRSETVLLERAYVSSVNQIQLEEAKFGEDVTFIGFPITDGSVGCSVYSGPRYGISVKAKNKDGAWAFIESYLTNAAQEEYNWSLPANKVQFEEMMHRQLNPEYVLDDEGNPILNENGEPATTAGSSTTWVGDWEYTYHTPTAEEAETLRKLIAAARPVDTLDTEILSIVLEESSAFFSGQKSVDEVVNIIQNRVQIYISENR